MTYPYYLCQKNLQIHPLFGDQIKGSPYIFDMSYRNPELQKINISDQQNFQKILEKELKINQKEWGIGGYLERRDSLLRDCPQMVESKRFFHLGIDITAPKNSRLYAPLAAEVIISDYERGHGNFGGRVLLKHTHESETFYSLYGHLNPDSLKKPGSYIEQGQEFARLGDFENNGNWFYHTHLQILTEKGYQQGFIDKGYCSENMLAEIADFCPNPIFLLRYL